MQPNLNMVIEQVGKDKSIDRTVLVQALEQAILTAAKKTFGANREMEATFNEDTGGVDLFLIVNVVEDEPEPGPRDHLVGRDAHGLEAELGDELLFQIFYRAEDAERAARAGRAVRRPARAQAAPTSNFGRIAAQTAKQVIYPARARGRARQHLQRVQGPQGRAHHRHRPPLRARQPHRRPGPRRGHPAVARAGPARVATAPATASRRYVLDIDRDARGPQIILSRAHKGLLEKLFEMEVPEIYEEIVRIESCGPRAGRARQDRGVVAATATSIRWAPASA